MNENIRRLLSEISELEEDLATVMNEQQERLRCQSEGSKIRFEENLRRCARNCSPKARAIRRTRRGTNSRINAVMVLRHDHLIMRLQECHDVYEFLYRYIAIIQRHL